MLGGSSALPLTLAVSRRSGDTAPDSRSAALVILAMTLPVRRCASRAWRTQSIIITIGIGSIIVTPSCIHACDVNSLPPQLRRILPLCHTDVVLHFTHTLPTLAISH